MSDDEAFKADIYDPPEGSKNDQAKATEVSSPASPEGSIKAEAIAPVEGSSRAEGAPPPEGSTRTEAPPPEGSTRTEAPPPEGSTRTEAPPPEGSTRTETPPPEGSTRTEAPPPPEGSTKAEGEAVEGSNKAEGSSAATKAAEVATGAVSLAKEGAGFIAGALTAAVQAVGEASKAESPAEGSQARPSPASPSSTSTSPPGGSDSKVPKRGKKADFGNARFGIIGGGRMGEALVKALHQFAKASGRVFMATKSGRSHDMFKQMGVVCTKRSYDIFGKLDCDIVFLAFHGWVIRNCFKKGGTRPMALTTNYIPRARHPTYLLSLVGGVSMYDIKQTLLNPDHPKKYRVSFYRIMLNIAIAYGVGMAVIDIEPDSTKCVPLIRDTLNSFGKLEYMPENMMDMACVVGGCGLAFVFFFLGALADSAFKHGIPKAVSVKLAAKTLQAAAACVIESGKNPTELRDQVTAPGGGAVYGLNALDKHEVGHGITAAMEGALKRIKDLANHPINEE